MEKINDGGPAFPGKASINRTSGELQAHQFGNDDFETLGMTLRDWFAGKAMQGYCAREESVDYDVGDIAADAYAIADAMLRARGAA